MTPKERAHYDAEIKCKLANERFGLQQGLRFVIEANFNCNDVAVAHILELATNRDLNELKLFMSHVGTNDSDKPRHTRIRTPSSVNGLY